MGVAKFLSVIQEVDVEPDTVYNFSAWSKILANTTINSTIKLEFYENDFTYINDALSNETLTFNNTTNWNKQELTFKTSPSTKKIKITIQTNKSLFGNTAPGSALFDSISLTKVNGSRNLLPVFPIEGNNILKNGSFQNGNRDWTFSHINDSSTVLLSSDFVEGATDSKSLKVDIKPLNADYGNVLIKQTIPVEPNSSYVFEGFTKGVNANNLIIRFNAEINNRLGTTQEKYFYRVPYSPSKNENEWIKKNLAFKTGANAISVTITLQVSYPDNNTNGSILFDNLKLIKNNDLNINDYSPLGGKMPFEPDKSMGQIIDDIFSNQINWEEFHLNMKETISMVDSGFKTMISGLEAFKSGLDQMNNGVITINKSLDEINKTLVELNKDMDGMVIAVTGITKTINGLVITFDELVISINGLVVDIDHLNEVIGYTNKEVEKLTGQIKGVNSSIKGYLKTLNKVNKDFNGINNQIDNLTDLIFNYGDDLNLLNVNIKELDYLFRIYNEDLGRIGETLYDVNDIIDLLSYHQSVINNGYYIEGLDFDKIKTIVKTDLTKLNFSKIDMSGFTLNGMDLSLSFPKYSKPGDPLIDPIFSLTLDLLPIIGELRAATDLGIRISKGEKLSTLDYTLAALGVVAGGKGKVGVAVTDKAKDSAQKISTKIITTENHKAIFEAYTGHKPINGVIHHGLPKEKVLREWLEERNINVQNPKYFFDLTYTEHSTKAGKGLHTNDSPLGKEWNALWKDYMRDFPNATQKQIEDYLDVLAKRAGIEGKRAQPKKR